MSYYELLMVGSSRKICSWQNQEQLSIFPGVVDGFGSLFNGSGDEGADAFTDFFGRLCDKVICGPVEVASNAVGKPLPWSPTLASVSLLRHKRILVAVLARNGPG